MRTLSKVPFKIGTTVESNGKYYIVTKSDRIGVLEKYNYGIILKRTRKPKDIK